MADMGENEGKNEPGEQCICRWEWGPIAIEEPAYEEFTQLLRASSFGGVRYYREAKHYITAGCPEHGGLLRVGLGGIDDAARVRKEGFEVSEETRATYFEFSGYRLRVPAKVWQAGGAKLSPYVRLNLCAFQFFHEQGVRDWAAEQAAWLVWKDFEDDHWKGDDGKKGGHWVLEYDEGDPYFWMLEAEGENGEVGQGHCAKCHHIHSLLCKGADHTLHGCYHTFGCPSC